jgi:hypothetical protein
MSSNKQKIVENKEIIKEDSNSLYKIVVNNKKIFEFYEKNKQFDIESLNLTFIEIIEKLQNDISSPLNANIGYQLLNHMTSLQSQINNMQQDNNNFFSLKLSEIRRDYIEEIKLNVNSNSNSNIEKLTLIMKDNNSLLQDKLFILLNTEIPKNNDNLKNLINDQLNLLQKTINEDTNKLLSNAIDKNTLDNFIHILDSKMSSTISNSQSIINNMVTNSETRLDKSILNVKESTEQKLFEVKSLTSSTQGVSKSLNDNLTELLRKMENSSKKGSYSENILYNILCSLYPTGDLEYVGNEKGTGDIIMKRENKPTILFENKNYGGHNNIPSAEVVKFIGDCERQNCSGIMMSQYNGIANKSNYQTDMNNGNILVYVHNVNNEAEKIKIAVDILDNFKQTYDKLSISKESVNIDKDLLDLINLEYKLFVTQKLNSIKILKEFNTKLLNQFDEIRMPCLETFLSERYAYSTSCVVCEICGYNAKNDRALKSHQRSETCKLKKNKPHNVTE